MKPGVQTSEFWLVVAIMLFSVATGFSVDNGSVSFHMTTDIKTVLSVVGSIYTLSRGAAKAAEVLKKPPPPTLDEKAVAKQLLQQLTESKS